MTTRPVADPAVGVCLADDGAVIAVVRGGPSGLAVIASATWPSLLSVPEPGSVRASLPYGGASLATARRMLARARRQLGLPRWQSVAVVLAPDLIDHRDTGSVRPRSAELLARAGLAQGWLVAPADASAHLRDNVLAARIASVLVNQRCELAVGAALASFRVVHALPAPSPTLAATQALMRPAVAQPAVVQPAVVQPAVSPQVAAQPPQPEPTSHDIETREWARRGATGWAVQLLLDRVEPKAPQPTNTQRPARHRGHRTGQPGWSDRRMS
jgi:hypothetical protein